MSRLAASVIACLLFSISFLHAQKGSDNVSEFSFTNVNAIVSEGEVAGYYMFYKTDQKEGRDYVYVLRIYDDNAAIKSESNVLAGKKTVLMQAEFNGEQFAFKFFDAKAKEMEIRFYSNEGEKIYSEIYEPSKMDLMMINSKPADHKHDKTLYPVSGKGFLNFKRYTNRREGYELSFYENGSQTAAWVYNSNKGNPFFLGANENLVVNMVFEGGLKDLRSYVVAIDMSNGKDKFTLNPGGDKFAETALSASFTPDGNTLNIFGNYFEREKDVFSGSSLGLVHTALNLEGKVQDKNYISWESDLSSIASIMDDKASLFFHDFVYTDEAVYGIAEEFRASKLGTGGTGYGTDLMVVENLYLIKLNRSYQPMGVEKVEKSKTKAKIMGVGGSLGPFVQGTLIDNARGFGFDYLRATSSNSFEVYYQNHEKRKGEKNTSVCGVVSVKGGETSVSKIDIDTEADEVKVLPANDGKVLFFEYFEKEQSINLSFKDL